MNLCKIGLHKLRYVEKYRDTALVRCSKCGVEYIEGMPGELSKVK